MDFCTPVNADMRVGTYSINELTKQKLIFVLNQMEQFNISIIFLIDARTTQKAAKVLARVAEKTMGLESRC